ncbi:MAG: hypothetical protein ACK4R6_12235 [Spirosomataceae bacterium]
MKQRSKIIIGIIAMIIVWGAYQRIFHGKEIDAKNALLNAEQAREIAADSIAKATENLSIEKIVEVIKKEPKVLQSFYNEKQKTMYVAVKDDGTNRTGYANYICQLLHENNARGIKVKIMEYKEDDNSDLDAGHRIILGKAECDF